jgi:hypothetical protein
MLRFIFIFSVFLNTIFASPTSSIPAGTGYQPKCSLYGLTTENVASYKVGSQTIAVDRIENYMSVQTPQGTIISANCKSGYYVFNPDKKPTEQTRTSFNLTCDKGSFKRVNPNEYCDLKCDIGELANFGYIVGMTTVLDPGQTLAISCPAGNTTKKGDEFNVTCSSGGMLNAESPACFPKANACTFTTGTFPEGSRLVCTAPFTNEMTTVSCEKAKWEDSAFYSLNQNTCRETIGEVNFEAQNLNELQLIDITDTLTLQQIIDFCETNPNDSECKPSLSECDYRGISYGSSHKITLYCQDYNSDINYTCLSGTWIFDSFKDPDNPLGLTEHVTLNECGVNAYLVGTSPPSEAKMQFQKLINRK